MWAYTDNMLKLKNFYQIQIKSFTGVNDAQFGLKF